MNRNKLLIPGGRGFVGEYLARAALEKGWEPLIPAREGFDITHVQQVFDFIEQHRPQVVVNLAAVADIDFAEKEKKLAEEVNVFGAGHLASACQEFGVKFLHISTDAVFDGEMESYNETAIPNPVNTYGLTKYEGEQRVLQICPTAIVLRVSLILGYSKPGRNSFVNKMINAAFGETPVFLPEDEIRTPIDVLTLSEAILELAEHSFSGVLHLGSTESISRYDLGRRLLIEAKLDPEWVQPLREIDPSRARRHKNGRFDVTKGRKFLKTKLLTLSETIDQALLTANVLSF